MHQHLTRVTFFKGKTILLHDRDSKYCKAFRQVFKQQGVDPLKLPAFSPDLNVHAERWVKSIKSECLQYLIPLGRGFIERAVTQYVLHYNIERAHQGLNNSVLTPLKAPFNKDSPVKVSHRIGNLLSYYYRQIPSYMPLGAKATET